MGTPAGVDSLEHLLAGGHERRNGLPADDVGGELDDVAEVEPGGAQRPADVVEGTAHLILGAGAVGAELAGHGNQPTGDGHR